MFYMDSHTSMIIAAIGVLTIGYGMYWLLTKIK